MSESALETLGMQISCQQAIDFIAQYLDHELPPDQLAIFAAHLAICEDCRNYLESYQSTLRLAKQSNLEPASESQLPIPEELIRAIIAAQQ